MNDAIKLAIEALEKFQPYLPPGTEIASKVREALAALRSVEPDRDAWQPIETAPINQVLLFCDDRGNRWTDLHRRRTGLPPLYWMSLPVPPAAIAQEKK